MDDELRCEQHQALTRTCCGRCGVPVCPECMIMTRVGVRCQGHPAGDIRHYRPSSMPRGSGFLLLWPIMFIATMFLPRLMRGPTAPAVMLGLVGLVVFVVWRFRR